MKLFSSDKYIQRRKELADKVGHGLIIIMGNEEAPMNYTHNTYRYRQDSNFLYYFGLDMPGLTATIDANTGRSTIYGNEYTIDDIIWIGPSEKLGSLAEKVGVSTVKPTNLLRGDIQKIDQRDIHYLPPYRHDNIMKLSDWLGLHHRDITTQYSSFLVKAVVSMRSYKDEDEIAQMNDAVNLTRAMHIRAMQATKPGKYEHEIVAELYATAKQKDCYLAYPAIFSINGQTLHNHGHANIMNSGRLALNDSGAENAMRYAGDITRTFPVNGRFTTPQKDIYNIVLEMEEKSIDLLKPGVSYRDIHINSNRILLTRFKELGLVQGDIESMLKEGVGGIFMPHGLGHMIGLDVHDMEDLGEKYVGYDEGQDRSTQLGLKSLRLARNLEEGFVITVEPGIYFIPELLEKVKREHMFTEYLNFDQISKYIDLGGIRIEDDILITAEGSHTLGDRIPKTIEEIEEIMG